MPTITRTEGVINALTHRPDMRVVMMTNDRHVSAMLWSDADDGVRGAVDAGAVAKLVERGVLVAEFWMGEPVNLVAFDLARRE